MNISHLSLASNFLLFAVRTMLQVMKTWIPEPETVDKIACPYMQLQLNRILVITDLRVCILHPFLSPFSSPLLSFLSLYPSPVVIVNSKTS